MTDSASRSLPSSSRSASSPLASCSFSAATSAISAFALASSLAALAAPISLDAALRRACASCSFVTWVRRASSSAISSADNGASPRFLSPASNAAGLSLIHLISNTSAFQFSAARSVPPSWPRRRPSTQVAAIAMPRITSNRTHQERLRRLAWMPACAAMTLVARHGWDVSSDGIVAGRRLVQPWPKWPPAWRLAGVRYAPRPRSRTRTRGSSAASWRSC